MPDRSSNGDRHAIRELPPIPEEWLNGVPPRPKPRRLATSPSCEVPGCGRLSYVFLSTRLGWYSICFGHEKMVKETHKHVSVRRVHLSGSGAT